MYKMVILASLLVLSACVADNNVHVDESLVSHDDKIMLMTVAPEKTLCHGFVLMECYIVDGKPFFDEIVGFDYQPGYWYQLKVRRTQPYTAENAPQDIGLYRYQLIEVLSKSKDQQGIDIDRK